MTTMSHAANRPMHPLPEGELLQDFLSFFSRLRHALVVSQTRRALGKLDDRQLADIGLARRDIDDIASRASLR